MGGRAVVMWVGGAFSQEDARPTSATASGPELPTLDFSGFAAGDIISDAKFFDEGALSEDEIRDFISTHNAGCLAGNDGTPCLADYTESTPTYSGDEYCSGGFTGDTNDDAAAIIEKAAQGCGISPKVLLVMLQKEQGLITASGSGLTSSRYLRAMGYACPDTSSCNTDYAGFARQVYFAARQFRVYEDEPKTYLVQPGMADVLFNPDRSCGSATIAVANQATANLYDYTPYQPNAAALAGGGDDCSSWGNLNFYGYYTAWFGSTH